VSSNKRTGGRSTFGVEQALRGATERDKHSTAVRRPPSRGRRVRGPDAKAVEDRMALQGRDAG